MPSLTSAVFWVPRGVASAAPQRAGLGPQEWIEAKKKLTEEPLPLELAGGDTAETDSEDEDTKMAPAGDAANNDDPFDMERYDEEDKEGQSNLFGTIERDVTELDDAAINQAGNECSDDEADKILPDDFLLLAANAANDMSSLEVYVYNEDNGSFYIHHEIQLSDMPSCLEWANMGQNRKNVGIIGFMNSSIELWDLNVVDAIEPIGVLGKPSSSNKKAAKDSPLRHFGPVMDLSKNAVKSQVLASASTDATVLLWDVSIMAPLLRFAHHSAEVQCVRWHTSEPNILASASYDNTVAIMDAMCPDKVHSVAIPVKKGATPLSLSWDPKNSNIFVVSTSSGQVIAYDSRCFSDSSATAESSIIWSLGAHGKDCSASFCGVPDLLMTCSEDNTAKIWNTSGTSPHVVAERNLQAGALLGVRPSTDVPHLFSFAGAEVVVWDLTDTPQVVQTFDLRED